MASSHRKNVVGKQARWIPQPLGGRATKDQKTPKDSPSHNHDQEGTTNIAMAIAMAIATDPLPPAPQKRKPFSTLLQTEAYLNQRSEPFYTHAI